MTQSDKTTAEPQQQQHAQQGLQGQQQQQQPSKSFAYRHLLPAQRPDSPPAGGPEYLDTATALPPLKRKRRGGGPRSACDTCRAKKIAVSLCSLHNNNRELHQLPNIKQLKQNSLSVCIMRHSKPFVFALVLCGMNEGAVDFVSDSDKSGGPNNMTAPFLWLAAVSSSQSGVSGGS